MNEDSAMRRKMKARVRAIKKADALRSELHKKYDSLEYKQKMQKAAKKIVEEAGGTIHIRDLIKKLKPLGYNAYDVACMINRIGLNGCNLIYIVEGC